MDVDEEMSRREAAAGQRWGSSGAQAAVDAVEEFHVERFCAQPSTRLLLTKTEAAQALAVSVRQLSRWVADGLITPTRIGAVARYSITELERFVEGHTSVSESKPWPHRGRR